MRPANQTISSCRHCQSYTSEGRRGGHCRQLGVPVQGSWTACSLSVPPFSPAWPDLTDVAEWPHSALGSRTLALPDMTLSEAEPIESNSSQLVF